MSTGPTPNLQYLRHRAELLRQLRQFFDQRGFFEVQPPCLSRGCIVDPYIDPIEVPGGQLRLAMELPDRYFLQTSPEAAMKRMLAAGAPSIYSIGPVFRSGERGARHNVEFTMLEWYQVDADGAAGIRLLGELATTILGLERYEIRTYRQLFRQYLNLDPITAPLSQLQQQVHRIDARFTAPDRDDLLDFLFSQKIEDELGRHCPLIVKDYPLSQAALAQPCAHDPQCAERFELFVQGVELANGYDELRSAAIYVGRANRNNERRLASGRQPLHVDPQLAREMHDGLPQCTGAALGVDRLLMVQTGATSIDQVQAFTIETC